MLEILSQTSIIIADGTFKACPEPFEQIYVIFRVFDERKTPLVFAFLEGKTTHHYRRLFEIINQKLGKISTFLIGALRKLSLILRQTLFRLFKQNFRTLFIGAVTFILLKQFSAECKIQDCRWLTGGMNN